MKPSDVESLLRDLLQTSGADEQLSARLGAVGLRDLDGGSLAAGARFLRERAVLVPGCEGSLDIVGTGGGSFRQLGTLNISTITALVCAAAGVSICKQGNRKASSTSGSSDVLEALGFPIGLGADEVRGCVQHTNFGYCFAPRFHPGLGALAPLRRQLGRPTLLNWLAPLANPARPGYVVLGTHDAQLAKLMAGALLELGVNRGTVVCGPNGLDELSVVSPSIVFTVDASAGDVRERTIVPSEEFGVAFETEPMGGDTTWNLKLAEQALGGHSESPYRETLRANIALALYTRGLHSLREGWLAAADMLATDMRDWCLQATMFHRSLVPGA